MIDPEKAAQVLAMSDPELFAKLRAGPELDDVSDEELQDFIRVARIVITCLLEDE